MNRGRATLWVGERAFAAVAAGCSGHPFAARCQFFDVVQHLFEPVVQRSALCEEGVCTGHHGGGFVAFVGGIDNDRRRLSHIADMVAEMDPGPVRKIHIEQVERIGFGLGKREAAVVAVGGIDLVAPLMKQLADKLGQVSIIFDN